MKTAAAALGLCALVLGVLLVLPGRVPEARGESASVSYNLDPLVTLSGPDSRITRRSYHRITDRASWVKLWHRHVGKDIAKHSDHYNPARVPDVDFERCMVLAVFQGKAANSAGVFAVESSDVDGTIRFRFDDRSYQTMGGFEACTAYGIFVVHRLPKEVTRTILLEENVQGLIGRPPVWKVRASFE